MIFNLKTLIDKINYHIIVYLVNIIIIILVIYKEDFVMN